MCPRWLRAVIRNWMEHGRWVSGNPVLPLPDFRERMDSRRPWIFCQRPIAEYPFLSPFLHYRFPEWFPVHSYLFLHLPLYSIRAENKSGYWIQLFAHGII